MPKIGEKTEIDLFASRLSNQLPSYYSWKPDPKSLETDALQQKLYHKSLYAFSPFDSQSTEKSRQGEIAFSNNSNSNLANPKLVQNPILLPLKEDLLKGPQNQQHSLIQNGT